MFQCASQSSVDGQRLDLGNLKPGGLNRRVCASPDGNTCHASIVGTHECYIDVKVEQTPCAGCHGRCLGQLIGKDSNKSVRVLRQYIENQSANLAVGDSVKISVTRGTLIGLSSLAYLVPVVLMLLFAVVCYGFVSRSEPMLAVMAMVGLAIGLVVCRITTHWYSQSFGPGIRIYPRR